MAQLLTDFAVADTVGAESATLSRSFERTGLDVEVITTVERLDAIESEWRKLERLSPNSAVFQSHAHLRLWARHFVGGEGNNYRLHIAIVRKSGRPVLILPLVITGLPFLRIARMAGDPVAQYSEVLIDPAVATTAAFESALRTVKSAGANAIVLRGVRDDSPLLELARHRFRSALDRQVAPYADLSSFVDHAAFLGSLPRKMRRGLVNRRNQLARAGVSEFRLIHDVTEARAVVAAAMDLKRKWLIQRGELSAAFVEPATRECLLDLVDSATGSVLAVLTINGEPAAFRFGFDYGKTHFSYMSSYDERFANLSPGRSLLNFCIAALWERGISKLDMLAPAGQHKSEWCRDEIGVADYTIPLSVTGRLHAGLYQGIGRPALAWGWNHLPQALRSLISALIVTI